MCHLKTNISFETPVLIDDFHRLGGVSRDKLRQLSCPWPAISSWLDMDLLASEKILEILLHLSIQQIMK